MREHCVRSQLEPVAPIPPFHGERRTIPARGRERRAGTMGVFNPETWPMIVAQLEPVAPC